MSRVDGKVAIVTGGALGIGRETCMLLAKEGAKVAVTDILDNEGQKVVGEIKSYGGVAKFWHLNVSKEEEVRKVFNEVFEEFSKIDVLVNNAGISGVNKMTHEITEKEWNTVMNVNVRSVFFCTKHVIPFMRKSGGGSIINLSSVYGIVGSQNVPPYHASKGAIRLMTKTDALLYARDNIRVNSVHPGCIWTPLMEELGKNSPQGLKAFKKYFDNLHPVGHVGEPIDIAYGILYLVSDESKFVTGSELVIDGGYTAQ